MPAATQHCPPRPGTANRFALRARPHPRPRSLRPRPQRAGRSSTPRPCQRLPAPVALSTAARRPASNTASTLIHSPFAWAPARHSRPSSPQPRRQLRRLQLRQHLSLDRCCPRHVLIISGICRVMLVCSVALGDTARRMMKRRWRRDVLIAILRLYRSSGNVLVDYKEFLFPGRWNGWIECYGTEYCDLRKRRWVRRKRWRHRLYAEWTLLVKETSHFPRFLQERRAVELQKRKPESLQIS